VYINQCIIERCGMGFKEMDEKSYFPALQKMVTDGLI
jgi:DNA-binding PadR family transcriptional regulator